MTTNFSINSRKIESKKLSSFLRKQKNSFQKSYNTLLSSRENFIIWAREIQNPKLTYKQIGDVFGVSLQAIEQEYKNLKKGRNL